MSEETATTQETAQAGKAFEPITTQAALDEIIKARITRERAKFAGYEDYKAKAAELDTFKATTGAELEATKTKLADAQAKIAAFEAKAQRDEWIAQVSAESGLPAQVIGALQGETLEELQASANSVAQSVKVPAVPKDPADRKPYAPAAGMQPRDAFAAFASQVLS